MTSAQVILVSVTSAVVAVGVMLLVASVRRSKDRNRD